VTEIRGVLDCWD